jgi:hypothetical protein
MRSEHITPVKPFCPKNKTDLTRTVRINDHGHNECSRHFERDLLL